MDTSGAGGVTGRLSGLCNWAGLMYLVVSGRVASYVCFKVFLLYFKKHIFDCWTRTVGQEFCCDY